MFFCYCRDVLWDIPPFGAGCKKCGNDAKKYLYRVRGIRSVNYEKPNYIICRRIMRFAPCSKIACAMIDYFHTVIFLNAKKFLKLEKNLTFAVRI